MLEKGKLKWHCPWPVTWQLTGLCDLTKLHHVWKNCHFNAFLSFFQGVNKFKSVVPLVIPVVPMLQCVDEILSAVILLKLCILKVSGYNFRVWPLNERKTYRYQWCCFLTIFYVFFYKMKLEFRLHFKVIVLKRLTQPLLISSILPCDCSHLVSAGSSQ